MPTRIVNRFVPVSLLAITTAAPLAAQDIKETELPKPAAAIKDVFKDPTRAIAYADGQLLVVDAKLEKMMRANFASGTATEVMSQGAEPGQYRFIAQLWNWPGDSVAVLDMGRGARAYVLPGAGGSPRTLTVMDSSILEEVQMPAGAAAAVAGRGAAAGTTGPRMRSPINPQRLIDGKYVYGTGNPPMTGERTMAGQAPPRTSLPLLRMSLETWAIDTVARFTPPQQNKLPVRGVNSATRATSVKFSNDITPLMPGDAWFVYSDGTVGIVRGTDYRIDLYGKDGARSKIDPIPYPKVAISDNEKKRFVEEFKKEMEAQIGAMNNRPAAVSYSDDWPWPENHPAFYPKSGARVDSKDRVWLHVRCQSNEKASCYDVIDRQGKRVARYRLAPTEELLTIGPSAVYTVNTEKKDKPVIQRHVID